MATTVRLEGHLDAASAGSLAEDLKKVLAGEGNPLLDASGLESVDGCGLQLLLSLVRDLKERGRAPEWKSASGALHEAAALLGISETLGLKEQP